MNRFLTDRQKHQRLLDLSIQAEASYAAAKRQALFRGAVAPVRHKCFVSYHGADIDEVTAFVEEFKDVFIPRVVGASDSDHFRDPVSSQDENYIKEQIGKKYLTDSTVTILYVGRCTWSRKYIDWELSSTLFNGKVNKRSGLMAVLPPGATSGTLPARFGDNWQDSSQRSYARFYTYPTSRDSLRLWIEDAFAARQSRAELIDNSRALRRSNSAC